MNISEEANLTELSPWRRFHQYQWLTATVLTTVNILVVLWVCVSLFAYGRLHRKFSKQKDGFALYISAVAAALSSLIFLASSFLAFNYGFRANENTACNIATKVAVELLVMGNSFVYLFLWIKQRSLYRSPTLKHLNKTWMKVISYASITLMVAGMQSAGILYNFLNTFASAKYGCRYVGHYKNWPALVASSGNALGQIMMLGLLLYPFCYAKKTGGRTGTAMIKRTIATTTVCVVTDGSAGIAAGIFVLSSNHLPMSIYGCSVTANVLAVLFTFETWKYIATAPCGRKHPHQATALHTSPINSSTGGS